MKLFTYLNETIIIHNNFKGNLVSIRLCCVCLTTRAVSFIYTSAYHQILHHYVNVTGRHE